MYAVEVRDRIMIAHSLPDPFFGPAQHMHGATYLVDVAFFRHELTRHNVVVDIGAALRILNETLRPLAYQNLDALPAEERADDDRVPVPAHFRPPGRGRADRRARRGWARPRQDPRDAVGDRPRAGELRGAVGD